MKPSQLPADLTGPFTVAAARALGVSRSRLRASDLSTPFYGVRATAPVPTDDLEASVRRRATEYAVTMRPGEFYCLVAGAVLWKAPLPPEVFRIRDAGGATIERPLDVGVILPARASRARGVLGRSIRTGWGSIRTAPETGLRVTSPATTWAMMGGLLGRNDLVALGDAFVREQMREDDPPALATMDELAAALSVGRRHGASRLRAALPLIRTRSRSRQETRTRLLLTAAGLPEPALNWPVIVEDDVVAMIDLAYPERRLGFEYEGEQHLTDPEQWASDIRRYEMLAELGWRIIRVTKSDLGAHRAAFTLRARTAFALRTDAGPRG